MILTCLVSDYKKTKHLSFRIAHLVIPVCAAIIFLAYYLNAPWDAQIKTEVYYQTLGIGFPILIALFSVMLAEQEASAASFQTMLSATKRLPMFYSKLILLVLSGTFSVLLASLLFGLGNMYVIKQSITDMSFYLSASLVLIVGNIFTYIFHWFLSLRFNKGVSIMIGIVESIVAALMLTGIGENTWCYIPCAWASRIITCMILKFVGMQTFDIKCLVAVLLCVVLTICSTFLFGIWVCHWEGQQTND